MEKGFPDWLLKPEFDTCRIVGWENKSAIVLTQVYDQKKEKAIEELPRQILIKWAIFFLLVFLFFFFICFFFFCFFFFDSQIEKAKEMGFGGMAATELEYYMYNESYTRLLGNNYQNMSLMGFYYQDSLLQHG